MITNVLYNTNLNGGGAGIVLQAPAKINISLVVFDKRPDGFHELHSVMSAVNLCDNLHFGLSDKKGISLHCKGIPSPAGQENLVYQAAVALAEYAGIEPALEISLEKNIPAGAGLGGASSDAATTLMALNQLWDIKLPANELMGIAAKLGSDIPFFLSGPVGLCTGRGENIIPLPHYCDNSVLLIMPDIHAATSLVYQNYHYDKAVCERHMQRVRYFLRLGDLDGLLAQGINTLTDVTMRLFPALAEIRDHLESLGIAPVHMSGSGSSLFVTHPLTEQLELWKRKILDYNLARACMVSFYNPANNKISD